MDSKESRRPKSRNVLAGGCVTGAILLETITPNSHTTIMAIAAQPTFTVSVIAGPRFGMIVYRQLA